jgi:hypothetical protein
MLKAVGLVAEHTAFVEEELRELLCCFIGPQGLVLGAGQDLRNLIEWNFRLANYSRLNDGDYERLTEILTAADKLRDERNMVMHSRWESTGGGRHIQVQSKGPRRTPRKGGSPGITAIDPEYVTSIADDLERVAQALVAFRVDVWNVGCHTWPFPRGFRLVPERKPEAPSGG